MRAFAWLLVWGAVVVLAWWWTFQGAEGDFLVAIGCGWGLGAAWDRFVRSREGGGEQRGK